MKEIEYLSAPEFDEKLNQLAIEYEEKEEILKEAKEETGGVEKALESGYAMDEEIKRAIRELLDRQDELNFKLEQEVESLRQELEWRTEQRLYGLSEKVGDCYIPQVRCNRSIVDSIAAQRII